ncbi:cystathionine beta-lyase [Methylobacterium brachythecii]|uniref:Cystathionine beta-lyase n=1 Tax=Methylobacterium brachythecii TaxID=1176177 RepID=A0A7W6AKN3_9HYPH|nr:cystathionine beta-lyase [Methylobacterium brachythecii]MBB3902924.1 cystathionine beta-lyase [Methylobacterium brachythecii]GLS43850.1 cystathionine beta-lyase [Methylobacterium brachythecii]
MSKTPPRDRSRFQADTRLVHAGRDPSAQQGFVNTPIYRGSTVLFPTYDDIKNRRGRYQYGTSGTPTMDALSDAWSEIAGAAGTVLTPSGLSALTIALMAAVSAGDHLLVTDSAYRPTRIFCDGVLSRYGVEVEYYDPLVGTDIAALMRENTRAVLVEAPGSQTFEMQDVPAIAEAMHARGGAVIMDNTWATPLLFPPHERGVDIAVEAGTKYLSGGSDLLIGLVSATERWYPAVKRTYEHFAPCAGPEDIFLGLRGLRTMGLRLREHGQRGIAMAEWLQGRPEVARVLHPALPSDPGHSIWKRDFKGASGLFGVILNPVSEDGLAAMLDGLELFGMGFSWGGFESLVIPFDPTVYRTATRWQAEGPALRFHIGLEDLDDLKADLEAGFARMAAVA